eukprot:11199184-Lingulodinium_polyedra.AAC.1
MAANKQSKLTSFNIDNNRKLITEKVHRSPFSITTGPCCNIVRSDAESDDENASQETILNPH